MNDGDLGGKRTLTFEEALAELEKIVELLESEKLTLDESIKLFEQGMALSRFCEEILDRAQRRIEVLVAGDGDGAEPELTDVFWEGERSETG